MPAGRMTSFRRGLVEQFPRLRPEHPTYKWLVLASVMVATFMAVLDATIVNVALSKLMSSFGVPVDRVEWVLTAYLLIFSVMLPSSGWLADHIGYKSIFMAGLALFTLGSFLCSLAWDFNILIAFRVVQGAGAGILMPVGMAIIMREFPPEKRGIALGFWTVAASASVSLGPTLGGYLIDNYSWHSIFDVNVPIGMAALVALGIILREYKSADVRKFDIIGFLSLGLFLACLQLALANGNSAWNTGGWTSSADFFGHGIHRAAPPDRIDSFPEFQFLGQQSGHVHFRHRNVREHFHAAHLSSEFPGVYAIPGRIGFSPDGYHAGAVGSARRYFFGQVQSQDSDHPRSGADGLRIL